VRSLLYSNHRGLFNELAAAQGKEETMNKGTAGTTGAFIWFMGWLFTIGFAGLVWWKIILGLVVWPFYLGQYIS